MCLKMVFRERVFFFKQKTAYEMLRSLVGSEMCIRDRSSTVQPRASDTRSATGTITSPAVRSENWMAPASRPCVSCSNPSACERSTIDRTSSTVNAEERGGFGVHRRGGAVDRRALAGGGVAARHAGPAGGCHPVLRPHGGRRDGAGGGPGVARARLHGRGSVSYTHLRAHETPEHLVCRLLLEK